MGSVLEQPEIEVVFPPGTNRWAKLQCNGVRKRYTRCPELAPVIPYIVERFPHGGPWAILDIGAGIGRASVYLDKIFGSDCCAREYFLVDGDRGSKQVCGANNQVCSEDCYNSFAATREFCEANGIDPRLLYVLDCKDQWAAEVMATAGSGKVDLVVSIKAMGFHWPFNPWLEWTRHITRPGTLLAFEVRNTRQNRGEMYDFTLEQFRKVDWSEYNLLRFNLIDEFPVALMERR